MKRTKINELKADARATISGFIETVRNQKSIMFIVLGDQGGKVQVTVFKPDLPEIAKVLEELQTGSVVEFVGKVVKNDSVKLGGIEFIPESVEVLSSAKVSPIDENTGVDIAMDHRWLDLRDPKKRAVFTVQTAIVSALREYCTGNGYTELMTPKITAQSTEGGSEVFELKYFNERAYLTQSPQLYKQMAIASGFEKYFEFTPIYRAEKSHTNRHATEAFVFDIELGYIKSHHDVLEEKEKIFKHVIKSVHQKCGKLIKDTFGIETKPDMPSIPRVSLLDSYELLKSEKNYVVPREKKGDLDPEGERLLCQIAKEKWDSDFIIIYDYPFAARAFYSQRHEENPELCKSFDLLYKYSEVTSGAKRESRPDALRQNMRDRGINPDDMEYYTQFFEYGCPPHGGFSLGLARFTAWMLDLPSIRDATFLFRGPDRLAP